MLCSTTGLVKRIEAKKIRQIKRPLTGPFGCKNLNNGEGKKMKKYALAEQRKNIERINQSRNMYAEDFKAMRRGESVEQYKKRMSK